MLVHVPTTMHLPAFQADPIFALSRARPAYVEARDFIVELYGLETGGEVWAVSFRGDSEELCHSREIGSRRKGRTKKQLQKKVEKASS